MAKRRSGVNVLARETVMVRVDAIQPHPRNARQGDVGAICESIKANGFYRPLVVQQSTGYVLAGNHTWMAARELGMSEVPVVWIDCDDDRAVRILLADNRLNDLADYATDKLAELLQEIQLETGTLLGTGFDGDALDELLAELNMETASPDAGETFKPEKLKSASVADLAPTEEERAILSGRKLLVEYSGGKDSSAAAVWARHYFPESETELLFVDMGADFVGFHLYLHDAAKYLGIPLRILRSERTVLDVMLEKGHWPGFLRPYCHECLHGPMDVYVKSHPSESVVILRGGRLAERSKNPQSGNWKQDGRAVVVQEGTAWGKRMAGYTYFQPLYYSDKDTSMRVMEDAGVPIWEGYSRGLRRTACRICPGQRPRAYAAIRANYPEVWQELLSLESRFGPGCWADPFEQSGKAALVPLADNGQAAFESDLPAGDDGDTGGA